MSRFLSSLAAAAFVLSLGAPSFAASSSTGGTMSSKHTTMSAKSCPKGQTYVKGYTTKTGKTVKGYCRKSK